LILVHILFIGRSFFVSLSIASFSITHHGENRGKAQEPRKRGRREWTTTSQKEFLMDQIPSYLAAQSGNSGKSRLDFWPPLWETYFTEWPLSLVSDEEKKEGKVDTKRWAKEKQVNFLSFFAVQQKLTLFIAGERLV
jgi:hypothetical protein